MNNKIPKAILIGNSGVGKTSLLYRILNNKFNSNSKTTIGIGLIPIHFKIGENNNFVFNLLDTAGQELYRSMIPNFLRDVTCAIIVFSFDDIDSFNDLEDWILLLNEKNEKKIPIVIVGNKSDLNIPLIDITIVKDWAFNKKYPIFITSCKNGQNIYNLFECVASICISNTEKEELFINPTPFIEEKEKKLCC